MNEDMYDIIHGVWNREISVDEAMEKIEDITGTESWDKLFVDSTIDEDEDSFSVPAFDHSKMREMK